MAREMKDSGIEGFPLMPSNWLVEPLKANFEFGKGLPITKEDLRETGEPVISYGQIHAKFNTGTTTHPELVRFVSSNYIDTNPQSLTQKGDYIFADTSEDTDGCGNCAYIDTNSPIFAGYHTIIARPKKDTISKYFAYLFRTDCWRNQIRCRVAGIKLFSITLKILAHNKIIIPPLPEQQRIAAYLDEKCADIDNLVSVEEGMIEELQAYKQSVITEAVTKGLDPNVPMKDSGNMWICSIPCEWSLSRVGLHHNIVLGKMLCSQQTTEEQSLERYYCAANVHFEGISGELKSMWFSPEEKRTYKVDTNDLLVVEGGAGAGGCAIVTSAEVPIYIQNSIMIVRSKGNASVSYLRYLIECLVKKGYIDFVCNKATIPHFTKEKLANVPLPLPPLPEQQSIAACLDEKCADIDALIAIKRGKIEELKEYKKSLIYEAVTGKIDLSA